MYIAGSDTHRFLLCPVNGSMRYARRAPAARTSESEPAQEMDLQLEDISIRCEFVTMVFRVVHGFLRSLTSGDSSSNLLYGTDLQLEDISIR